jgi:hypothetical protein
VQGGVHRFSFGAGQRDCLSHRRLVADAAAVIELELAVPARRAFIGRDGAVLD